MYTRQITSEETYTLAEARKIIELERAEKREVYLNKAKQKLLGILAIGVSITELILGYVGLIDEGGAFILMLPIGLCLLFSRKEIV